jgi:vitamin B12 transporter
LLFILERLAIMMKSYNSIIVMLLINLIVLNNNALGVTKNQTGNILKHSTTNNPWNYVAQTFHSEKISNNDSENRVNPETTVKNKDKTTHKQEKDVKNENLEPKLDNNHENQHTKQPETAPIIQFGQCKEEQVLSPSYIPEDIKTSSSNVDVITEKEIDVINATSLSEILRTVEGINTYSNGSRGSLSPYRIRGWNKSLLTLDGIRINSEDFNAPYLENFNAFGFDRIEVLRGPQGTMYGTQAQGGLIGLYTKVGHGRPQIHIESGMGNNSTFQESFETSAGNKHADYYLGVIRLDTTGGAPTRPDFSSVNDDYRNLTVVSNIGARLLNGKAEIRNTFRYINAEKEIGLQSNGFPDFNPRHNSFNSYGYETLSFKHAPAKFYDYNVNFGLVKSRYKDFDPRDPQDSGFMWAPYYRSDNTRLVFNTQHNLRYKNINTLSIGYNLEYNDYSSIDDIGTQFDKDLTKNDVYFHDILNIKDILFIRGGCRITDSNFFGTYGTPNVSGALILPTFKLKESYTKLRASYGYAVTEATPSQLFNPFWGNPDLTPEKLQGWDAGIVQSFYHDRFRIEGTYYKNSLKDLIQYNYFSNTFQNISKARTRGWEVSLRAQPVKPVEVIVNYTYTYAKQLDTMTGIYTDLIAYPRHQWNYLLVYTPKTNYNVFMSGFGTSAREGFTRKSDAFFDLGIGANVKLLEKKGFKLSLWGKLGNILNKKYEEIEGYKHPGIHFLAGLKLTKTF